jgi:hypothetical protein
MFLSISAFAQQQVENTNRGVANAQRGNYIIRLNGQRVVLNQGDINYARWQLGISTDFSENEISETHIDNKIQEVMPEFHNLQWRINDEEINEAHVDDRIIISFESKNVLDDTLVSIEIWRKKDGELVDFITDLQGTVKDNFFTLDWVVDLDMHDESTNYFREIEETGHAIIDYIFIIKYNDINIASKLLEILAWFETHCIDYVTGEPLRNWDFVLLTPDRQFIAVTTDDEGYIRVRNLRMHGRYNIIG